MRLKLILSILLIITCCIKWLPVQAIFNSYEAKLTGSNITLLDEVSQTKQAGKYTAKEENDFNDMGDGGNELISDDDTNGNTRNENTAVYSAASKAEDADESLMAENLKEIDASTDTQSIDGTISTLQIYDPISKKYIDIAAFNRYSLSELKHFKGIGDVIATRIVDYRQTNGGFQSFDELESIKGIGPKKLAQITSEMP